ncbi:hypothetical protein BWQ96_10234 [Gracilariopsis chorda]|uniref:Uncharacterized protein n=1 Tax=Gracilariopsis chorda TaxID=448386 RepID=A0A2V3IDB4_9FLOR|nr:hypothetical protein BWQ96_10234 [Gracilariopsis chorda]|eukprot:PXF40057.1 hypothetical protein BWQ96_10234 [Gracilariopsis chorda]
MYFLACILCESSQAGDVERAKEILEEIISRVHYEPAVMLLASMYQNNSIVRDYVRATRLYRLASRLFDNSEAKRRYGLLCLWDKPGLRANPDESFRVFHELYTTTGDVATGHVMMCLYWSGTKSFAHDRVRAIQLCQEHIGGQPRTYLTMASMYRYGHPHVLERCPEEALRLLECVECQPQDENYVLRQMMLAIVLSENKDLNLVLAQRIFDIFYEISQAFQRQTFYLWLPLYLRQTHILLPVSGSLKQITQALMKEEQGLVVAALNFSSLLFEEHSNLFDENPGQKAVAMLKSVLQQIDNELVKVNLAYALWYGLAGARKEPNEAISLLENVMRTSSHQLARTFMANILAERQQVGDVPRAVELWAFVTRYLRDVEEVRRLACLFSRKAAKAIEEYSLQPLLRHMATDLQKVVQTSKFLS